MEFTGLETVPRAARDAVREFAVWLHHQSRGKSLGLALFGPVCALDFDPRRDLVRSVLIAPSIELTSLRDMAVEGKRFARQRIAAPLIMTPAFIKASQDSYPLELIEIQQQHVMLWGDDPFAALAFDAQHVRLQCERELKSMTIGMRQGLLASSGQERELRPIVDRTVDGLLRTVRGLIWFKVDPEPRPLATIITEVESLAGQPLPGIRRALADPDAYDWQEFVDLYHDVETLGRFTDAW